MPDQIARGDAADLRVDEGREGLGLGRRRAPVALHHGGRRTPTESGALGEERYVEHDHRRRAEGQGSAQDRGRRGQATRMMMIMISSSVTVLIVIVSAPPASASSAAAAKAATC
jgi:hypothetical protein